MARQKYRGNVLAANFPLLSSFTGKTVVLPQIDQYYITANNFTGAEADHKLGIPQVMFMENVMPMTNGLQAVGYEQAVPFVFVTPPDVTDFDQAIWLRDKNERRTLYVPAHGRNYTFNVVANAWEERRIAVSRDAAVSVANIKERTFICYSNYQTFIEWNGTTFVGVSFNGLVASAVLGIVAANSYLIAYTDDTLYWSSILNPTDFIPSLATTAGSTGVLAIKGKIVYCTAITDGFIIFTTHNAIAALYNGNARFPFTFKEIAGSPGIQNAEQVTQDNNARFQFALTGAGVVKFNTSDSTVVYPELNEFLSCRRFETFDYEKKEIVEHKLLQKLNTKIHFVAQRYLVISYGIGNLTHAIVYDFTISRWGKLKIDHVDCFEFIGYPSVSDGVDSVQYDELVGSYAAQTLTYAEFGGIEIPGVVGEAQEPYKTLAFLQADGKVAIVNFNLPATDRLGVLYVGKYQHVRTRNVNLYEVWMENVQADAEMRILPSMNGNSFDKAVVPWLDKDESNERQQKWLVDLTCHNFAIQLVGCFDLTSNELVFAPAGYN